MGIMKILTLLTRLLTKSKSPQAYKSPSRNLMKRVRERKDADEKLKAKLIQMLNGKIEEAEKLVAKQRFGKDGVYSENYCYWLAIRELEREQKGQT